MKLALIGISVIVGFALFLLIVGYFLVKWLSTALREAEGEFDPVQWEERTSIDGKTYLMPKTSKKNYNTNQK